MGEGGRQWKGLFQYCTCLKTTSHHSDNWRKSLQDSLESQKVDPSNAKAYFRGAKAAMKLREYQLCWSQCEAGVAIDAKAITQFSALRRVRVSYVWTC